MIPSPHHIKKIKIQGGVTMFAVIGAILVAVGEIIEIILEK